MIRRVACARALAFAAVLAGAGCDATLAFEADDAALSDGASDCNATGCPLSSLHCDVASGACVECVQKSDCKNATLPFCDVSTHACVDCLADGDCAPGYTCIVAAKQCVPACSATTPCLEGTCDTTKHACVRCENDVECKDDGQNLVCDLTTHQCVTCVVDKTCPTDHPRCDPATQRCVQCMRAGDCSPGEVCDPTRRTCVKA